jgi:hypothetical protein
MKKQRISLSDGRYLIYYNFEDEKKSTPETKENPTSKKSVKQLKDISKP